MLYIRSISTACCAVELSDVVRPPETSVYKLCGRLLRINDITCNNIHSSQWNKTEPDHTERQQTTV